MDKGSGHPEAPRRIGDLISLRRHPTVVRLDRREEEWIEEAFVRTGPLANHLEALGRVLARETGQGIFVIGQYGSGKSHLLAYLSRRLERGDESRKPRRVVAISLLNHPGHEPLERLVLAAVGLEPTTDRRDAWGAVEGPLVLVLDELSEFLRSKPDPARFNEDVRFLQFLGEWAQDRPLWILAALQEAIEHTGELEVDLYRKIKDRFPLRLVLDPTHVEDLVADAILRRAPGAREATERLWSELEAALPGAPVDRRDFVRLYPVHPVALELLEEVRESFSQARGVVDFVVGQLGGRDGRDAPPFLDRPWGDLLGPDRIVDHFDDLFEIQPEFLPLAQKVLPWARRELPELFGAPARLELARRLLKLLILVHLSPRREDLGPEEAAAWLLLRVSRIDPEADLRLVEKVLAELASHGRFIRRHGTRYRLELDDDDIELFERALDRERLELDARGELVFEELSEALADAPFAPPALTRGRWLARRVRWSFHPRAFAVLVTGAAGVEESPPDSAEVRLAVRLPWGVREPVPETTTVVPRALRLGSDTVESAALERLAGRSWSPPVRQKLEDRRREGRAAFRAAVEQAYLAAEVVDPDGAVKPLPRPPSPLEHDAWLERVAESALRRRFPAFERFAPAHGPLADETWRRFLAFGLEHDLGSESDDEHVRLVFEGYLLPMGLVRRDGRRYLPKARLEQHELVRQVLPILEHEPPPEVLVEHLAAAPYGLVPDQVGVLLAVLFLNGEVDLVTRGRSLRETLQVRANPLRCDRVVAGARLSPAELRALETLREGLGLRRVERWSVLAQRRAAEELRRFATARRAELQQLGLRLGEIGETDGGLAGRIETAHAKWSALDRGDDDPLAGLRAFLLEVGAPISRFLDLVASLRDLPARIDRLAGDRRRFGHLLGHPAVTDPPRPELVAELTALAPAPALDRPEELERWVAEVRGAWDRYRAAYGRAHDAFWLDVHRGEAWSWAPPAVAASRHLGLDGPVDRVRELRRRSRELDCPGLSDLAFQPLCRCGFDGLTAPVAEPLAALARLRDEIEAELERFFGREDIRERLTGAEGIEPAGALEELLAGRSRWPRLAPEQLDRVLSGLAPVRKLSWRPLTRLLGSRTWSRAELLAELDRHLRREVGDERFRIRPPERSEARVAPDPALQEALAALERAEPLGRGVGRRLDEELAERLVPADVDPEIWRRLDRLGLGPGARSRLLRAVATGEVRVPVADPAPAVGAALELVRPSRPRDFRELADLARRLYGLDPELAAAAGEPWLERLDALARQALPEPPERLVAILERSPSDETWVVLDAFGLPLLGALEDVLRELLRDWQEPEVGVARVEAPTTTDAWYREMAGAGLDRRAIKWDAIDALLHRRPRLDLIELERLAAAALREGPRSPLADLDPDRGVLVFADHGFRLAPDRAAWIHGGDSVLERLVPVLRFRAAGD